MSYQPRMLEKFENIAGSVTVDFPSAEFEQESESPLRVPVASLLGAHHGLDLLGGNPGLFDFGSERLRAVVHETAGPATVDTKVDELTSEVWGIGLGKIFTIDSAGARRWAYARVRSIPRLTWRAGDIFQKGVALDFVRLSPWLGTTQITDTHTITASPTTYTVSNPGNLPATFVVIRLRANTAGGFTNPKVENTTTVQTPFGSVLYTFETARDSASSNSEVRLSTGTPVDDAAAEYSNDNGGSYADDFAQIVIPTAHRVLGFALAPGNNSIRVTVGGTPNVDVEIAAWAAYAA